MMNENKIEWELIWLVGLHFNVVSRGSRMFSGRLLNKQAPLSSTLSLSGGDVSCVEPGDRIWRSTVRKPCTGTAWRQCVFCSGA